MKLAVAGLGYRMSRVLKSFKKVMPTMRLSGLMDPAPAGLAEIEAAGINIPPRYDTIEAMLAAEKPDLLMVGSPNFLHLEHITAGLRAGVRVFTEKPVVIDEEQTLEFARLLAEYGTDSVLVGLVLRYSDLYRDLRAAQAAGHLGEIASIEASEHIAPYHGAFFMRDWRRYHKYSGSFILEKCCHDLDLYASVVGERPVSVASFGGRKSFIPQNAPAALSDDEKEQYFRKPSGWKSSSAIFDGDGDIIDYQTALVEYANRATLVFHTNLNVPDQFRRFCVIGSKGMAEGDFIRNYFNVHDAATGRKVTECRYEGHESDHYGADDQMAADIVAHLLEGAPLAVGVVEALEAGLTAIKIDAARRNHKMLDLTKTWQDFDAALSGRNGRAR